MKPINFDGKLDWELKSRFYMPLLKAKDCLSSGVNYKIDMELRSILRSKFEGNLGNKMTDGMREYIRIEDETK